MEDLLKLRNFIAKTKKKKGKLNPHSLNRYIYSTRTVFIWGVTHELIPFNPWEKYKKPKEKPPKPNLLTVDEYLTVMKHAAPHLRWALDVEYHTGCRPGETELFKLKFSDVNWEAKKIIIRSTKTGDREVPLKPKFVERLKKALKKTASDFIITYRGNPVKRINKSLSTALKKAGIKKKVRPYDIRHLYGTLMAKNKVDIFAIQQLMGHGGIETTKGYLHHAEEMKEDAVNNCLPDIDL